MTKASVYTLQEQEEVYRIRSENQAPLGDKKLDGYIKSPTQETDFTVKITSKNTLALAKFAHTVQAQFKPWSISRVIYNPSTKEYIVYMDFSSAEILEKLQEVSPFPC